MDGGMGGFMRERSGALASCYAEAIPSRSWQETQEDASQTGKNLLELHQLELWIHHLDHHRPDQNAGDGSGAPVNGATFSKCYFRDGLPVSIRRQSTSCLPGLVVVYSQFTVV